MLNIGGIKLSTCQSLIFKLMGCVDAGPRGIPHVARFIQPRIEHQRDRQTDWTQPGDGAEVSEFTGPSFDPEEIQEAKQTGWPQGEYIIDRLKECPLSASRVYRVIQDRGRE